MKNIIKSDVNNSQQTNKNTTLNEYRLREISYGTLMLF